MKSIPLLPVPQRAKHMAVALIVASTFFSQHLAIAQVVNLGTAKSYGVLAYSTITSTGGTFITGDVGLSPDSAVTGLLPIQYTGALNVDNPAAVQAKSDLNTAINQLQGLTPTVSYGAGYTLQNLNLGAGIYNSSSTFGVTGSLTLNGNGNPNSIFVFQAGSSLITATGSQMSLINGAQACHVFWVVGSSATLGTGSVFDGSILALTSISLNTGAVLNGRALALNGQVSMDNNTITVPVCASNAAPVGPVVVAPGVVVTVVTNLPTGPTIGTVIPLGGGLVLVSAPSSYMEFAATPNQSNVASAVYGFNTATNGDKLAVAVALNLLPITNAQTAFNAMMPTMYQSIGTMAFNLANAQNSELVQRLWGLRVAGTGFSMTGLPDNTPVYEEYKNPVSDKNPVSGNKNPVQPAFRTGLGDRWGVFVDANGIYAKANSANMLPTYNSESGGVTTGLTYKWNESFGTGIYAGYEGSYNRFPGVSQGSTSRLIDNSVRFGLFGTYGQPDGKGFYADALAGGGYNNYQVSRNISFGSASSINRTANSTPGAGELDTMLAGGYDFKAGNWTFGPMAIAQYTYLGVNGVNETGAQSLNFSSGGWNTASLLSTLGGQVGYTWKVNKSVVVVPQINLGWQHEFMQNPYAINGNLGGGPTFSNWSSTPIRDWLYTGVGFTVTFGSRWNTSLFYNAAVGNPNLVSQNLFASVGMNF